MIEDSPSHVMFSKYIGIALKAVRNLSTKISTFNLIMQIQYIYRTTLNEVTVNQYPNASSWNNYFRYPIKIKQKQSRLTSVNILIQ